MSLAISCLGTKNLTKEDVIAALFDIAIIAAIVTVSIGILTHADFTKSLPAAMGKEAAISFLTMAGCVALLDIAVTMRKKAQKPYDTHEVPSWGSK